jgi:hypothetical protein
MLKFFLIFTLALLWPTAGHLKEPPLKPSSPCVLGVDFDLTNLRSLEKTFKSDLDEFLSRPIYVRISVATALLKRLDSKTRTENKDYVFPAERHDLNSEAGRAAHAIEALLKIKLPFVTPRSTEAEQLRIQQEATHSLAVYRTALRETLNSLPEDQAAKDAREAKIKELLSKVSLGKPVEFEQWVSGIHAMNSILEIWNPIGLTTKDLEDRYGLAPNRQEEFVTYGSQSKQKSREYRFVLDDSKRIAAVFIQEY